MGFFFGIKYQVVNVNFYVDSDLETFKAFFIKNLAPFYEAFNPVVNSLKKRKTVLSSL
jgi:hypothetical protein